MPSKRRAQLQEAAEAFEGLQYLGLTIAQESAAKIGNEYRKRGKRAMAEKDSVLACRNFAASLFTELNSRRVRWDVVRELRELIERACDAHVADAVRPSNKPLTGAQIRAKREW